MRTIGVIAWKEFKGFFTGATAYVAGGLLVGMLSYMFYQILSAFAERSFMQMLQSQGHGGNMSLNEWVFPPHFGNTNVLLLFFIPPIQTHKMLGITKHPRIHGITFTVIPSISRS